MTLPDVRQALRLLAHSPLFTITSVGSLAIGLAAATTIVGLADALFLQASPGIRDATRVVTLDRTTNGAGFGTMSYPVFRYLRDHARSFESMAATTKDPLPLSLSDGSTSARVFGAVVSGSFFDVLAVRPALGRFFRPDEDAVPEARPVVVVSHRFWRAQFASDPTVVGRAIQINGTPMTVIGVAEPGFDGLTMAVTDLWVPMAMAGPMRGERTTALLDDPSPVGQWHIAVGRLSPGTTRETAQAELTTLLTVFKASTPAVPASTGIRVAPSGRLPTQMRSRFAPFVALLFAFAGGLLVIACSNVAGMMLARASARRREMGTRLAIGASRAQLLGQLLVETLVLFVVAGLVSLPLTMWMCGAFEALLPAFPYPIRLDLSVTLRSLLFVGVAAPAAGLLFGLAPARHALRTDLLQTLSGQSSTESRERLRVRHAMVVIQVALSLAMAITSGLFVRTLLTAARLDPGFETAGVEIASVDTSLVGATGPRAEALAERISERLRAIGGVEVVAHARMVPLASGSLDLGGIRVPGANEATSARLGTADWDAVSPDYFRAIALPIVHGRAFAAGDAAAGPLVAIVNEAFARTAWPGQPAVGQRFFQTNSDREARLLEVVGVARDAAYQALGEAPRPFVYVPFAQQPQTRVEFFVKHAAGQAIAREIHAAVAGAEPRLPVVMLRSFDEAAAGGLFPQRLAAWIAGCVGLIGMALAALGLYGLVALLVAQRTREIAIRMALGASPRDVRRMVLGQAARLGAVGAGAGLLLASGLGSLVRALLLGVEPTDPITFGSLALAMSAVLFVASDLPARRAAATAPAVAFRS